MIHDAYDIFFETLANRKRLKIIEALMKKSLNVSQIIKETKFEQSTVSHNLQRLKRCGFVKVKQNGKERVYTINNTTIKPLMKLIERHVNSFCKHCLKEERIRS